MRCRFGFDAEVVSSLAKWKRLMLRRYDCAPGSGLFCESTSIRKGYKGDVTHSNICDQWDWEVVVTRKQRTLDMLKSTVRTVYGMIKDCEAMVAQRWPALQPTLPEDIHFITAEELQSEWPEADIHGREDEAVRRWGAIFIIGMGWPMKDGSAPEEVRAPDYDDVRIPPASRLGLLCISQVEAYHILGTHSQGTSLRPAPSRRSHCELHYMMVLGDARWKHVLYLVSNKLCYFWHLCRIWGT